MGSGLASQQSMFVLTVRLLKNLLLMHFCFHCPSTFIEMDKRVYVLLGHPQYLEDALKTARMVKLLYENGICYSFSNELSPVNGQC